MPPPGRRLAEHRRGAGEPRTLSLSVFTKLVERTVGRRSDKHCAGPEQSAPEVAVLYDQGSAVAWLLTGAQAADTGQMTDCKTLLHAHGFSSSQEHAMLRNIPWRRRGLLGVQPPKCEAMAARNLGSGSSSWRGRS
jgi:hypothetical protein